MPPLVIDGKVDPEEYEVRIDTPTHAVEVHPAGAPVVSEYYYSFDGVCLHFGIRKVRPCKTKGVSIWVDPDSNGCEVGDLLVAVQAPDTIFAYGIYEAPGKAAQVAGSPPDPVVAGVQVKCDPEGDVEVQLDVERQYANGLTPSPLPETMLVNITLQAEIDGEMVINYLRDAPIKTFTMDFEME